MTIETRLFIDGAYADSVGKETFELKNPATGETVAAIPIANAADIDRAVAAAARAQPAWAAAAPAVRIACLQKLANLIEKNGAEIARLDAIAMGRPVSGQAGLDIPYACAKLRFDANLCQSVVGQSSTLTPGQLNLLIREPYGVVAGIAPFNVPLIMFVSKVGPATGAGNAIILKSSEKSPLGAAFLAGLTVEAGFPPGIVNVVSGAGSTGQLLAEHMKIRKISFTGSTRTGRLVAAAAAKSNLKDVSLELGGKTPAIVFDDANLDQAVGATAFSAQWNSGQICIMNSRIYVHEQVKDAFLEKFKVAFGTAKHGSPEDPATTLGPQADESQGKSVLAYIDIGKADGKVLLGGGRVEGMTGPFIQPTIFTDIPDDSRINKEEVFGPVVVIHTFTDEKEVVARANDSEFGLYAAVFTKNIDRAIRVAKALEAGQVAINCSSPSGGNEMPFGGTKGSGMGRENGLDSVMRWTEEKSVFIALEE